MIIVSFLGREVEEVYGGGTGKKEGGCGIFRGEGNREITVKI